MKRKPPAGNVRRVQSIDGNLRYTITSKTGRIVQCESHLERRLALRLDRNRMVRDYTSQPETMHFINAKGEVQSYTPDFKSWLLDGRVHIHEVTLLSRREHNPRLP